MPALNARQEILSRIQPKNPDRHPLPDVPAFQWPGDPLTNFIEKLINFDGRAVKFKTRQDAVDWLAKQENMNPAKNKIYSSTQDVSGNVDKDSLTDSDKIAGIDICVTEGILGVGETGSIWVTDNSLETVPAALLCRQLYVLLDSRKILGGLHEAYEKIELAKNQYGSFFSGPSATADIEAVHITGAQGSLSLTALLYNVEQAPEQPELLVNPNADYSVWEQR